MVGGGEGLVDALFGEAEFTTQPDTATILGAAKLTGRVGQFSVGGLTAVTASEYADTAGFGGLDTRESMVEPLTTYSVARARREDANQSALGFMMTSTNRKNNESFSILTDNAFTGGVDYDWRPSQKYSLNGYWAGSYLEGTPESITRIQENTVHSYQRPDSDYTEVDESATTMRATAVRWRSRRSAANVPASAASSATRRRDSTSTISASSAAPTNGR